MVADIDESCRALRAKGVQFTKEPEDAQWGGRGASFLDPDGHGLQLTEMDWSRYFAANAPR